MPLVLVTGISTSGKSAVAKELVQRGYEAYDTEHNGISAYFNKQTGERAAEFGQAPKRTEAWLNQHEWRISVDWVGEMAEKAQNKLVFLCGGGTNEPDICELCDRVVWLRTNEATIRQRVNNPRDHDYGTRPHELAKAIEGNQRKEAEYADYGAIMVDATQSINEVVDDIILVVQQ